MERALSAGYELLITPGKNPDEIVSQAQKLYDTFISGARKLTVTGRFLGDGNSYLEGVYLEDCRITA